jgi:hypothetical protein
MQVYREINPKDAVCSLSRKRRVMYFSTTVALRDFLGKNKTWICILQPFEDLKITPEFM